MKKPQRRRSSKRERARLVKLAMSGDTPIQTLLDLYFTGSPPVLRALASNPNAPSKMLFNLARRYLKNFLENPVLPLLFLENPGFFSELHPSVVSNLRYFKGLPLYIWAQIANHKEDSIRRYIAGDYYTPPVILASRFEEENSLWVRAALIDNANLPRGICELHSGKDRKYIDMLLYALRNERAQHGSHYQRGREFTCYWSWAATFRISDRLGAEDAHKARLGEYPMFRESAWREDAKQIVRDVARSVGKLV